MRWYGSLRRSGEIAYVRRAGRRVTRTTLAAFAVPNIDPTATRVCISVSKAVGGSVVRNLVRRRIRGALEALAPGPGEPTPLGLRLVIVAEPPAASEPYARLAADVRAALERLRDGTPAEGRTRPLRATRS